MRSLSLALALLLLGLCPMLARAELTRQLVYQGRITVAGKDYTGMGAFRFALLDSGGKVLWSTGEMSAAGVPAKSVQLAVAEGTYQVLLGDARMGMLPIDPAIIARTDGLRLRIWFDDGKHGLLKVGYDQPLASPPFSAPPSEQLVQVLTELQQLKQQVAALQRPAAQPHPQPQPQAPIIVNLAMRNGVALGDPNAPLTLVEFTDLQCPFCRRFHDDTLPLLKKQYIDTGKVRFITRHQPLSFHNFAHGASLAALAAAQQGKYWEMRARLFTNNTALQPADLTRYATELGLDMPKFAAAQADAALAEQIKQDIADATAAGITGTPTFVLGRVNGTTLTGEKLVGAQPATAFDAAIARALAARPAP